MSAQSAKKKRIGSRRRVANQNEISKADEFHVGDSTSVAESHIPEEQTESLNVLANFDNSQSESQHPSSPELSGGRRKLGSSRRHKVRHVKDSVTESYHEAREEVEDKTREKETTVTKQTPLAIQSVRQEALSQGSEHDDMFATPDYSSEIQNTATTNYPEADLESLIPKGGNLPTDLDENENDSEVVSDSYKLAETAQEGIDISILHSEEVKERAHLVGIPELTSLSALSCPTVDQQLIDLSNFKEMPEEKLPSVCSVTEKEGKERDDDTESFRQDGNLQGSYLVSESHVESVVMQFSTTPEITTEKISPTENTEVECSVGQAILLSPKEELPTDEEQNEHFNLSEIRGAPHSEDDVNKQHEQEIRPTEKHMPHDDTENSEVISVNMTDQPEVSDTYQSELTEKSTDGSPTNQDISYPEDKEDEHPTDENNFELLQQNNEDYHVYDTKEPQISDLERVDSALGQVYEIEGRVEDDIKPSAEQTAHQDKEGLFSEVEESESSLLTVQSEINAPLDSQPQQDDTSFNPIGSRRKLGSSRRNRGRRHVKDSAAESDHEHKEDVESTRGNEAIETAQMLLATERTSQEELSQGSEYDVIPETHDSSLYSATITDYSSEVHSPTTTNYPEADLESLIPESENLQEDLDERETHFKVEVSDKSVGATLEGSDKSDSPQSQEVKGQHHSEDAVNKEHEHEVKPTENQEMPQIDNSSESVMHDATENSEIISGHLTDQTEVSDTYQSELTEKSTDGSPTNQDISYPEDKGDEHPTDEVVYEIEGRVEDDIKPSAEQTAHQDKEGLFSEVEESESSSLTVQSEINAPLDSQPQQDDTSFNPIGSRRKLGSSRRNRGRRHVKDSAAESDHEPTEDIVGNTRDNEPLEITEMSLTIETAVQEKSMETMLEGMDTFDSPQTEDVSDQVKENAHVGTVVGIDLHSSSTVDQQTIDQSNFREMPDEELLNVSSVTEKENKERDEDTELFRQDGHLQTNYLVSEDIESSITPEITTEKHSSRESTEPEYSVEQAIFPSLEEELPTNEEQKEIFKLPEVKGQHHSEDAVNKEHEHEVKPTENLEMPQIHNSSESVMHDATENSEIISGHLTDQTEVSDTYQSELTEKSTDGSPTNQDISYPEDKGDEHPTDENNFEALEQNNEDYHDYDTKEPQISDIERVDSALGQVYEIEGPVEDDIKPSAEQTAHQEKEGLFSEVEESESSLLTVQSEINAPLDSQPQQDDTSFNPIGSRRKLGSSRRNRGRRYVKDSAAESDHEHKEDVESTRGNEATETAQMSLTIETAVQEKSMETMLEGMDTFDSPQTEDVSDQVKENAHVGTVVGIDLHSSSTVDQQTIDQSNFREMPDEELLNVSSVTEKENKERDEDTELFRQDGHLQTNYLVSEDIESSITPEITTEKHSSRENTEPEYSVEQAIFPSLEEELPTNEEQKEIFKLPEVKGQHHSEDAVNKEHEHKVKPTENQEMPQIDNSSESVMHDATENSEIISVNMTDQPEVSDTYQSELTEKSTDGSPTNQDISNPEEQQDEHPTDENNFELLQQKNKDYHVYDTKEPQISDIERVDSALGQVYEIEGRVEDDIKPSAEQTAHQDKEGLFSEVEESESSLLTVQSEINAPLDSQPQQDDTSFNPIGSRRKLGSSRRNRGRRHVKDSAAESDHEHKEDVESTRGNEATETAQMLLATERTSQEELSQGSEHDVIPETHDSSLYSATITDYSAEVHSPTTTNYPEADLESLIPESENLQEDLDERETHFKVEVSDKSVGATLEGSDKSDSPQSQEVKGQHHSEDAVNKEHEHEVKPTENQEMPQIDNSSESVMHDATENSEIISGHLTDQTEVSDTYQSELTEKSTDGSPTNQDISYPEDKGDEHPTDEVVYEIEGPVEDDIKPSAEQTAHQKKEGLFSEVEESESSLLTVQSEINAPLDSQPQQDDTSFNPIGSRRKLGSSRRNRGRRHVKDSAAESDHEPIEDIVGNTRDNEPLEITEMSLTIETAVQEKSMDTMLEGMDTFDSAQTEDVSEQVKENAHVGTVVGIDLHSSSTVDQQTIDQSNFREMPDEELLNVSSVTEKENKERDEDTELFRQDGHLQTNYLVSEDIESSITPEITTEKHSSRENTEPEYSVEQAIFPSLEEELPTNEEQKEIFKLPEVKGQHHSENAVNKEHEHKVKPTENQEMPQIDNSSESVMHDATENSEIISGHLTDQTEVSDTYQSELTEKSTDGSPTNQDISNLEEQQDEHPTDENNFELLQQKNKDYHVYDTKEPQISDIERVDSALGQVYEIEGRVEDDIKPSAEQTAHQDKEGLFSEVEESEFSLLTVQSEINAPLDSQPQQDDTSFNPIGSRRKLGSSRRNRGRRHVKDSAAESDHEHKEDVESTRGNEAIETAQMLLATERTSQEELSQGSEHDVIPETHDSSLYSATITDHSSEVHSPTTTNYPEADLESLIPESENLQEDLDEREIHFKVEVSDKSVGATLEGSDKSDSPQSQEVKGQHHSEDAVNKEHEHEVKPTENLEMPQIHNSSESVMHDATENSEIISGHLTDQTEVSDTYQSELTEKSTDGSPTNQDISYPEDKEDEHPTDEVVYEIEGPVEDDIKPSAEQTTHQEKEGLFSEVEESESSLLTVQSEINAPLDSQPQQDDTSFNPIGSRRKLGSSRRNRGRRHVKDSAAESDHEPIEDIVGNTRDNEPLEITEMSLTIETAVQEKSMETMLEGMDTFDSAQTEDVSDQVKENAHVGTQERDEDTESFRQDENLQTNYLVSETQSKSEDKEFSISPGVSSENSSPGEHTEIECSVEQAAFSSSKEEMSTNEERTEHVVSLGARPSEDVVNKVHEEVIKPTQMQEMPQIDNSSIKDRESSLQTMQSEHFDSQPLDNSQIITEQTHTGFSPKGNRRKLGSSRRQKGRLHVEDTTKMSLPMETKRQEELKEQTDLDFKFAGEIRSTVNNEGNTEKMLEEDTIVATDMTSSSGKDDFVKSSEEVNEEECKLIKETENLSQLGCDTVQMDLIQSLDVSATAVNMQQTNDTPENVGDVTKQDYETEAESSMHVQVYGLDEDGEQFEDITKKDHEAHEMNVSPDITHAERFSSAHDKTDTLAPFDVGLEENIQAEPAVDASEESGISSQQGIQERTNLDDGENLQGRSKQKRRKLGSTRRIQLNRKPEEKRVERKDLNAEADMSSLDKIEVVEELTMTVTAEGSQNENAKPSLSPVDKEQQDTISKALLPEQSASHNEEVVNPVKFVHVADVRDSERNVQPSQIDDFTVTEMHISDLLSANTEDSTSTGITDWDFVSSCETTQSTQGDEDRPASVNVTQDQSLKSAEAPVMADFEIVKSAVRGGAAKEHTSEQASEQEPDDADEGAHNKHLEMKNASPNLDSTNRRRKMGSSRRNLGSRTKREDLNQKQEVDDEATETKTNVGDVKTVSFSGNVEDEQQLHTEHKDSEQRKEPETVAYSHTDEENPVSHGQLVETEHQLTPSYLPSTPSTSPKHDSMSQSSPGRRRKMGSHRKSHGHQNHENQTAGGDRKTNNERDVRSIIDESAIKTTEELRERPHGLDKISEVDHSDKKPSSNISTAKEGELSRPVIEKTPEPVTPVQRPDAEIVLGQESQHKFSLAGDSRGAGLRSNAYNVMMVGDSCVGKSSFMKRAQSGKFSLEIPASVGLDSCKWTVVVDGKPVVLQLWDTAGQERFHSLTRQIFHKAHAFLLMYDITSSQSFSAVSYWASCIQEGAAEDVTILLAGNKSDCAERQVNTEKAEALAKEYHFEFMECSAATGENVVHCLETVARMLSQKVDTREEDLVLHKEPQQRKSGCC